MKFSLATSMIARAGALAVALLFASIANAAEFRRAVSFEDAFDASCRVNVSGARGTGFFIGSSGQTAYVVTNYHVVSNNNAARLDFWTNGKMESVSARVAWRVYDANVPQDFAVLAVNVGDLEKINPPFVALGGSDAKPAVGAVVISSGAPDGRFTQAWKGQILEYYNGKTAVFSPPPVPGQSGSAICEYVDGELFVTGVLTWLFGEKGSDNAKGGAIPVANLYDALARRGVSVDYHDAEVDPIPPDATECDGKTQPESPCVLEFTQSDCPPCLEAENDVRLLRSLGTPVYTYNIETDRGAEYAARYHVEVTPSFVILDSEFRPVKTITGAGHAHDVFTVVSSLRSTPAVTVDQNEGTTAGDSSAPSLPATGFSQSLAPVTTTPPRSALPLDSPAVLPIAPAPRVDFRTRPPVYEDAQEVGIFEDSDRRWRDRNDRRRDDDGANRSDDDKDDAKLRDKLAGDSVNALTDAIEKRLAQRGTEMIDKLRDKWKAMRFTILMAACLALAVALVVAEGIVATIKFAAGRIIDNYNAARAALAVVESQKNQKKEDTHD